MSKSPPLLEGLDRFEAVSLIHEGKGRDLWLIRDRREGRMEAIKRCSDPNDGAGRAAIAEEYLLLERLRHPCWIRPLGFHHLPDGSCGYRMPFVSGGPPRHPDAAGFAPSDPEAIRAILGALATLHALGIAHLDLKPSQILLAPDGPIVIDPGLAAAEGAPIPPRGTWGFIAPELLAGEAWDRRADLYALGCLLIQVWTGESPLGDGEIAEQARRKAGRHARNLRTRLPDLPEGVDRWMDTLLAPGRADRPGDCLAAWGALHPLAGYRSGYGIKSRLPGPSDLPFIPSDDLEERWRRALRGEGPDRWCIEGPWGSGRRRLLQRLNAVAETAGVAAGLERDRLEAGSVVCRIGRRQVGEECVVLGAAGMKSARAALEAFGLEPEGGEGEWLPALLHLRILERRGGEPERRLAARSRRSLAAATCEGLSAPSVDRLAAVLAALGEDERPSVQPGDPLVIAGLARADAQGRLAPLIPPWDAESLRVLAGREGLARAHQALLASPSAGGTASDPAARALHAVEAGEAERTAELIPDAIDRLRGEGRQGIALDLLEKAERVAGGTLPDRWRAWRAVLAYEEGNPARCLALLRRGPDAAPPGWRRVIEAYIAFRSGRHREAIDLAAPIGGERIEEDLAFAAKMVVLRALVAQRKWSEAAEASERLLREISPSDSPVRRSGPAQILLTALRAQGRPASETDPVRAMCEQELDRVGLRDRQTLANALGADAFQQGRFDEARRFFRIAADAAEAAGDMANAIVARANLAGILFEEGMLAESEAMNREVVALAEGMVDERRAAVGRRSLAAVLLYGGHLGEALEAIRMARAGFDSLEDSGASVDSLALEVSILVELGLREGAEAFASSLENGANRERLDPIAAAILHRDRARAAREEGRFEEAQRLFAASRAAAAASGAADEVERTDLEARALAAALLQPVSPETGRDALPDETFSADIEVRRLFVQAMEAAAGTSEEGASAAVDWLERAALRSEEAQLRLMGWRCRAAEAGLRQRMGDGVGALRSLRLATDALTNLLKRIGPEALRESFISRADPRRFLAWCEGDPSVASGLSAGCSDLEVFLR